MFKFFWKKEKLTTNKKSTTTEKEYDRIFENYLNERFDKLNDIDRKILCDNRVIIDNKNVTLRNICAGLGIDVPEKYESIADEPQTMAFRAKKTKPGDICLFIRSAEDFKVRDYDTKHMYETAIQNGAKLIIMGKEDFIKMNLNEDDFPVILMDRPNIRIYRFFSQLRDQQKAKVVMLTGSVGKTTTKDICEVVVKKNFEAFANQRNTNTPHQVAYHAFYNTNDTNEVYIQESGLGYRGSVRMSAEMLQPDIFILTNVMEHHLQVFKTMERLFDEKVCTDKYMRKDGLIITNFDDERIRQHSFKHKVKAFGIQNQDVDYHARNITQENQLLHFDIYERETGEVTSVAVNILGEHNVYNILAAFALGRALGLSNETIQSSLLTYKPSGVRQNLTNIGGVHMILDCYNVAEASILSILKTGEQFKLKDGAKKYAIIGGENKLGKEVVERSKAFGYEVAKHNIDQYLFCGKEDRALKTLNSYGDAASIMESFSEVSDIPNQFASTPQEIEQYLRKYIKRGDLVMFKGIYLLDMPIAADKAFGSSFSFGLSNYVDKSKTFEIDGYTLNLIEDFGEVQIVAAPLKDGKLMIPDEIEHYPVFRIQNNAFSNQENILDIDFGKAMKNIGKRAFMNCKNLKKITIPGNVKVIESRAFADCKSIQSVLLEDGVTHIGSEAFANCSMLKEFTIPVSVGMIEENAFLKCDNIVLLCQADSFAHKYALEHDYEYKLV